MLYVLFFSLITLVSCFSKINAMESLKETGQLNFDDRILTLKACAANKVVNILTSEEELNKKMDCFL